jgi:glutamyl-tRNA(Gln) amidotransferase subunit E
MNIVDWGAAGLEVGLEVHQQLATRHKLFCACPPQEAMTFDVEFTRKLRPTQSELGQVDPAALFEFAKGKRVRYLAAPAITCLVETDEEPPHALNPEAVQTAILVALALQSRIVDELHVMRKLVIDGSNTTGFQRTVVVAIGGELHAGKHVVPVQSVTLEEDAARLSTEAPNERVFALDRLGVPLVEVSLAPVQAGPAELQQVALALGRLLRATRRVARGLGTIRQDLNISLAGGNVVEVKGVQKLDLLGDIIEYEATRMQALRRIAQELKARGLRRDYVGSPADVTDEFEKLSSTAIRKALAGGGRVFAIRLKGAAGLLGLEPSPGVRLGKELAELVRFYGLGGVFHSDELPGYGITEEILSRLRRLVAAGPEDAFVLLAGPADALTAAARAVRERAIEALDGVPAETRGPTPEGKTRFIRPRPGPARMYPETDVPPVAAENILGGLKELVPRPWEEQVLALQTKHGLSPQLAEEVFDSPYADLFEQLVATTKIPVSVLAVTLAETLVSVGREGIAVERISDSSLREIFRALETGAMSKEAIPDVLRALGSGAAADVPNALSKLGVRPLSRDEVEVLVQRVIAQNVEMIRTRRDRGHAALMGKVMAEVRGRADGKLVSELLRKELNRMEKAGSSRAE